MWITDAPDSVRRIDYEVIDPYIPIATDRNGTTGRFVMLAAFKRVEKQDNYINLAKAVAPTEEAEQRFYRKRPKDLSYRTLMSNLNDEMIAELKRMKEEKRSKNINGNHQQEEAD